MVNLSIPSAMKGVNFFSDMTTEEVSEKEEVEKQIITTVDSPNFSIPVSEIEFIVSLPVFISTYLFKIFIPPSL
jgi:hypothetical protein